MAAQRPGLQFVLPAVPSLRQVIEQHVADVGGVPGLQVLDGRSHDALAACDVSLVASGTATLEAALFKRPMVIAYNMHWFSWWLMKGKKLQPWVGLPNILCQSFVVPELLQDKATPHAMAEAVLAWLDQPEKVRKLTQRFTDLHDQLLRDTPTLSAHAIESLLAR
jgi:lipid-A-disaccharide synthase